MNVPVPSPCFFSGETCDTSSGVPDFLKKQLKSRKKARGNLLIYHGIQSLLNRVILYNIYYIYVYIYIYRSNRWELLVGMFLQKGYAGTVDPKTQFLSSDAGQPAGLMSHKKKIPDMQVGCIEPG